MYPFAPAADIDYLTAARRVFVYLSCVQEKTVALSFFLKQRFVLWAIMYVATHALESFSYLIVI
jgi:hypothetical protein